MTFIFIIILLSFSEFWKSEIIYQFARVNIALSHFSVGMWFAFLGGVITLVQFTRYEAFFVVYGNVNELEQATLVLEKETVITDNVERYVGKTKNYIFLYNVNTGFAKSYALSDVKQFSLRDAKPHLFRSRVVEITAPKKPVVVDSINSKGSLVLPVMLDADTSSH